MEMTFIYTTSQGRAQLVVHSYQLVFAPFDSLILFLLFTRENTPTNEEDLFMPFWKRGDNCISLN
jgi:hypothetical protein